MTFNNSSFAFLASGSLGGVPFTIVQVVIAAVIAVVLTRATALGLFIRIGRQQRDDKPVLQASICASGEEIMVVYTFCGLCAGVAGLIKTADISGRRTPNTSGLVPGTGRDSGGKHRRDGADRRAVFADRIAHRGDRDADADDDVSGARYSAGD